MAKSIESGSIITVGPKAESFQMIAEKITDTHVSGTLYGTEMRAAWCTVLRADIIKVEAPTPGSMKFAKRAKAFREESAAITAADLPKSEPKAEKPKREAPKRTSGGPTKRDLAIEIARKNPTATRPQLIDLLVNELGMTPAGASTYASEARKALKA